MLQRHRSAGIVSVGIARSPLRRLTVFVESVILLPLVHTVVARAESSLHRGCVDTQFECGSRLTLSGHLVILPMIIVNIADPSLDSARFRLHRHKCAMQEFHHIPYGVHRTHHLRAHLVGSIVVKQFYAMRQIHIIIHRIRVVGITCQQLLVVVCFFGYVFNKSLLLLTVLVAPRILIAPVGLEIALHLLHVLHHSLLGILLHTRVDGRVDAQSVAIEILVIVLAPSILQLIGKHIAEIRRLAVGRPHRRIFQFYRQLAQRVILLVRKKLFAQQVAQHHIAAAL